MDDVTAFVLAGGRSSRMGSDKAFLELAGSTLLVRALQLAQAVAKQVRTVGPRHRFPGRADLVEDIYPDRGPLGGIHAALKSTSTELNLVLAVDLPFVENRFLEYLLGEARACGSLVTVPRAGGGFQPLCAVYRRAFAEAAERALLQGRNKIDPLFNGADIRILEETELQRLAFFPEMFHNLNTPEEWQEAQRRLQGSTLRAEN